MILAAPPSSRRRPQSSSRAWSHSGRRTGTDQLTSIIATALHAAASHQRVHVFGSLCGQDDAFNPPERIKVFLHRWKAAVGGGGKGGLSVPRLAAGATESSDAVMATVVFHTIGVPQQVVRKLVGDLFQEDHYWNL